MSAAAKAQDETATPGDVSLGAYTAIKAALTEEFSLEEVLATEGVPSSEWAEASPAWMERIATDPETFTAFARELADAEDALARKVTPIESDVGAWVSFLAAFKPAVRAETLKKTGLRMTDVSRLRRHWERRAQKEPDVGKKLGEHRAQLEKAAQVTLPEISVEPLELKPSRFARGRAVTPPSEASSPQNEPSSVELGLDEYAAVVADLQAGPTGHAEILARHALSTEAFAELERSWTQRFQTDPTARRDFALLVAHAKRKAPRSAVRPIDLGQSEPAPPAHSPEPRAIHEPTPAMSVERYASLCTELGAWPARSSEILQRYGLTERTKAELDASFRARLAVDGALYDAWRRASQSYLEWLRSQAGTAPAASGAETADISSFVPREALPFAEGRGSPAPLAAPSAPAAPPLSPAGSGTEDITSLVPRAPLPFADAKAPAAAAETADITSLVPRDLLPFAHSPAAPAAAVPVASPGRAAAPAPIAIEEHEPQVGTGTQDITSLVRAALPFPQKRVEPPSEPVGSGTQDISALVPRAATPFPDSGAPRPGMRLVRFDPQTGKPLPEPRWVEVPPDPPKR